MPRRTRRSVSTLGGAAPDSIIGRAAADRAGARPYRAHVAKTRRNEPRRIAAERVPTIGIDLIPYVDAHGQPPDDVTIICETVHWPAKITQKLKPRAHCELESFGFSAIIIKPVP